MASTTRLVVLASALLFAACAGQPDATECATGITCPATTKCAAVQPVCITNDCGDGIVQMTEKCDDGNIQDGDGCAANCLSTETCGDGVINSAAGELCDDSNTQGGDGCAADCRSVEVCGNGIRDVNEVCDDGNTVPGDGCNGTCTSTEICGNGIKDVGEICDDEGMPGGCNNDCQGGTGCGDGAIDKDGVGNPLEECDDGNNIDTDDCRKVMIGGNVVCKLAQCGDGVEQTSGSRVEECDPGAAGETADCNKDCTDNTCGDGVVNHTALEQCDDGGMNDDHRDCTPACQLNICGDGKPNTMGTTGEQCDDGNSIQMDTCSNLCTVPTCGNGIVEKDEACDDGNTNNNDGCSGTDRPGLTKCHFESCGDGLINNGEPCDPGPAFETNSCNSDCTPAMCGDQKVNHAAGEQCEEMNTDDDDACRPPSLAAGVRCTWNVCGDGNKNVLAEACDDGNSINTDSCTNSCTQPTCGDGIVNNGEACDDGNNGIQTDGCKDGCILPTCGDGIVWAGVEECDNGVANNSNTGDCTLACKTAKCGDGFVDSVGADLSQKELCDDGNNMTETTCPYGTASCTFCDAGCDSTTTISGNVCGDGVQVSPEVCDDDNRVTETTCPYGTPTCSGVYCNDTCTALISPLTGPYCGDGVKQALYEACDDRSPSQSCGLCSDGCGYEKAATKATAFLLIPAGGAPLLDTDNFSLSDGFATTTFELDVANNGATSGRIRIVAKAGDSATTVRDNAVTAITSMAAGLKLDAMAIGANGILITHQLASALGNQPILKTVSSGDFYAPAAMTGGWGRDCLDAVECNVDDDCRSGRCVSHVCTACSNNGDCPGAATCYSGACIP